MKEIYESSAWKDRNKYKFRPYKILGIKLKWYQKFYVIIGSVYLSVKNYIFPEPYSKRWWDKLLKTMIKH